MSAGRAFTVAIVMGAALALTGSARAQLVPEVKLRISGPGPGQNFGACVARGGDINGDGYDDFLVGAPKAPGTRNEAGRVYIVLGGTDLDTVPDLTILGRYATGHFGASVAGVGDFNGDGYDDYVVGNPEYNLGLVSGTYGRAWVYFGGARLSDVN